MGIIAPTILSGVGGGGQLTFMINFIIQYSRENVPFRLPLPLLVPSYVSGIILDHRTICILAAIKECLVDGYY